MERLATNPSSTLISDDRDLKCIVPSINKQLILQKPILKAGQKVLETKSQNGHPGCQEESRDRLGLAKDPSNGSLDDEDSRGNLKNGEYRMEIKGITSEAVYHDQELQPYRSGPAYQCQVI